ncbi:MAG: hypothetical protein FJX74_23165, partial [Armatimonadetes bacterium]|nr:hypothetical protein [Armatimonadota bacterium]
VGAAERQAEFRHLRPLCAYARPGDDTAIPKAALFCSGILREDASVSLREQLERFGRGVELAFRCDVPIGSGLGSSSILGAAILAALAGLCGRNPTPAELFEEVLQLEQMLTTGGGWQDQVGGVTGGIKMTTSKPGSPQELRARRVKLSAPVADELHRRMLLYHTGYTRVAKDILESVMGRYIAREPAVVAALGELKGLARLAERGLRSGGLDDVGVAMSEQWRRNKVLDPDSTNPKIDALFEALTPLVCGAKLAGAGGGGFLAVMRWGPDGSPSAERIVRVLARMAPEGRPYAFEINDRGLQLRVE